MAIGKTTWLVIILCFITVGCTTPRDFVREKMEKKYQNRSENAHVNNLKKCDVQKFTVSPVEISYLDHIIPLGNLNPPEHTLPTEHTYWHLTKSDVELLAPGDIRIVRLTSNTDTDTGETDYGMHFALCEDVFGYFLHVKTLIPELQNILDKEGCDNFQEYSHYQYCSKSVDLQVPARTKLGTVGNQQQTNFDFGLYDESRELEYANKDRYEGRSRYIACPLDYYEEGLKNQLYKKLDRTDGSCGTPMQDIAGTLQGNWFYVEDGFYPHGWTKQLAFVPDNMDPSKNVLSLGGPIKPPIRSEFTPITSGVFNRQFSDVTPDETIYCYETPNGHDRVIVLMIDENNIKVEMQSMECDDNLKFDNETRYVR